MPHLERNNGSDDDDDDDDGKMVICEDRDVDGMCIYTHTYICTYIHTHTNTHTYTHMHIHSVIFCYTLISDYKQVLIVNAFSFSRFWSEF